MKFVLSLPLILLLLPVYGQVTSSTPVVLTHISEENGLSDNHINVVYKDKQEVLWIGTKDGLNTLDGSTLRIYKNMPADSNSLCNNYINGIVEDNNGDMWISTAGGVCCFKKKEKKFCYLKAGNKNGEYGGTTNIIKDNSNTLWFGSGGGLLQYNLLTKKLSLYRNNSIAFSSDTTRSNKVNYVLAATDNTIWLATEDGLWNFSPVTKTFTKIIHKQNDAFYHPLCFTVYEDADKNIWAGFWNSGLKKYNPTTSKLIDYGKGLNHNYTVTDISEVQLPGSKKVMWLNGELLVFDEKADTYFHLQQPVNEKTTFTARPAYQSADGWLWLASDNGLYIYNPLQQVFNHQSGRGIITSQGICFQEYKNNLLIGAQDLDFLKLKKEDGTVIKDYSYMCKNSTAMLCMIPSGHDEFWAGTTDGILHTNLANNDYRWFQHIDDDSASLPRNFITSLFLDSKQNLWVFPWREGIWQMDKQTGHCKKLWDGFINESGKIKKLLINDAKEDELGNIWMADLDEGIILYNAVTKSFSKPFENLTGSRIHTSRIFLKNGKLYSSTPAAILRWTAATKSLEILTLPAEMSKGISDMYPDNSGNWWLSTSNGLIMFNEANGSFRRFTTADGLFQNDINGVLYCTKNNLMTIGSPGYFSFFNPVKLSLSSSVKKNIYISEFIAGDKNILLIDSKTSLSYNQNNIIVRWALPAFNNPFRNRYYYQLRGIDSTWRYAGNKGEVQYANLSAGHYTLLLKAATANETESGNTIILNFTIRPPYWKTWWFKAILILAISSLFFAVVRYVSQRNLKEKLLRLEKEQAIEKERNRISRDMHDDLGSGLTKIAIMSEVVKKQMSEPEKAKQQLDNISQSSRELVDNLQDIVWILNPKNDNLDSLATYIREYGLKFFEPFGIYLHFNYPENFSAIKLSEETRRNIFLVVKETFNNTVKHAWCNKITVEIQQTAQEIMFNIKDDGKGFDLENVRQFGNGLINMQNRIKQIDGTYLIISQPGKGTTTSIKIPL